MSMWQLVERVERFIIFNVMQEVMIIMVMFIWRQIKKAGLQTQGGMEWVNGKPKFYSADKHLTNRYHACDTTHKANSKDEFRDGYYLRGDTFLNVIVWRGENGNNVHCTTNLNQETWGTAKS